MRTFLGSLVGSSHSIVGFDNAGDYGIWTDGSNDGYGFSSWDFDAVGIAGTFLGSSTSQGFGDINTGGISFGAYGNPSGGNYVDIKRNLSSPLSVGFALSATLAVAFRSGNKGVSVYSDTNWSTEVFNFNCGVTTGTEQYSINNADITGVNYSQQMIVRVVLTQITSTSFSYSVKLLDNSPIIDTTTNVGTIKGIKFYCANTNSTGDLNNLYFNSLKVYRVEEPLSIIPTSTYTTFTSYE